MALANGISSWSRVRVAAAASLLPLVVVGSARDALALDAEVDATTAAQAYAFSSPLSSLIIKRRRAVQTLALGLYHLGGDAEPGAADFSARFRMRVDADFGIDPAETAYSVTSGRFVPGLAAEPIDLMYGYVEGRNLARGLFAFRVGRQHLVDSLGFWSFDGGLVRLTTPVFFSVEGYGGLEQRGGLPLSTPRFEQNGMWRGDRTGFESGTYPQFIKAAVAPAYGIALESAGISFLHTRFDYRKVENRGDAVVALFPDPMTGGYATTNQTRVSSERLGYAVDTSLRGIGGAKGGLVYDLLGGLYSSLYGGIDCYPTERLTVGADYDYFRPTFDGDSIFNVFASGPMQTVTARTAWDGGDFDAAISGGTRMFYVEGDPAKPARLSDWLGNASGRYRWSTGAAGVSALLERGDRGRREGGDIRGEKYFMGGRWLAEARTSLYDFRDELRPDRGATSFAYVLGGGFRPNDTARLRLEWEHDVNRLVGQRYRILALLDLTVAK
jgi:hypothetical protein